MAIKLITLDLDHTLWNPDDALQRGEAASYDWLATQHPPFAEQFPVDVFADMRLQMREQIPGLKHRVSDIRRMAAQQALQQTGMDAIEAQRLSEQAFTIFWHIRQQVQMFDDTVALLEQLSQRYMLGAISNGNACLSTIGLAHYFRFHFAAENFPAGKPAADMFLAALEKTGVAPQETLHIGDHPVDDMQGAQAVGIKTLWVNFDNTPWPLAIPEPDFTVTSLPDILHRLHGQ